jgi:class 3 adenylate cyclase
MAADQVARKLAAILASDVAAYSRLAGADEERTLARLRALRSDLIDPIISVHAAWKALSHGARSLYVTLKSRYNIKLQARDHKADQESPADERQER